MSLEAVIVVINAERGSNSLELILFAVITCSSAINKAQVQEKVFIMLLMCP